MIGTRPRVTRLVIAALLVLPGPRRLRLPLPRRAVQAGRRGGQAEAPCGPKTSSRPSNEQYNQAVYELQQAQQHLDEALAMKKAAEQQAATARDALSKRAVQAYTDMGSQYESLLSAGSMSEFSDRLEFLGAITQTDADLAARPTRRRSRPRGPPRSTTTPSPTPAKADAKRPARSRPQRTLTSRPAARQSAEPSTPTTVGSSSAGPRMPAAEPDHHTASRTSPPPSSGGGDGGGASSHRPTSAPELRSAAAQSVLGAPYVFGAAGPSSFDCSGLTSWAWAQAGVYLPHSASAQYSSLPARAAGPGPARRHHLLRQLRTPRRDVHRWRPDRPRASPRPRRRGPAGLDVRLRPPVGAVRPG